jgi:hypothetical protein
MKGPMSARDIGGAGLEDTIPKPPGPQVFVACVLPASGGIWISVNTTEAGAKAWFAGKAAEYGVSVDALNGTVASTELETP